jgi:hypothetical protein
MPDIVGHGLCFSCDNLGLLPTPTQRVNYLLHRTCNNKNTFSTKKKKKMKRKKPMTILINQEIIKNSRLPDEESDDVGTGEMLM